MATTAELQATLAKYEAARDKILDGAQSYTTPDGVTYTRGRLFRLENKIDELQRRIAIAQKSKRIPYSRVVF